MWERTDLTTLALDFTAYMDTIIGFVEDQAEDKEGTASVTHEYFVRRGSPAKIPVGRLRRSCMSTAPHTHFHLRSGASTKSCSTCQNDPRKPSSLARAGSSLSLNSASRLSLTPKTASEWI